MQYLVGQYLVVQYLYDLLWSILNVQKQQNYIIVSSILFTGEIRLYNAVERMNRFVVESAV